MTVENLEGLKIILYVFSGIFTFVGICTIVDSLNCCKIESQNSRNYSFSQDMLNALQKGTVVSVIIHVLIHLIIFFAYYNYLAWLPTTEISKGWIDTSVIVFGIIGFIGLVLLNFNAVEDYSARNGWNGALNIRKSIVKYCYINNEYNTRIKNLKKQHKKQLS